MKLLKNCLTICLTLLCMLVLVSCIKDKGTVELDTPVVTINETGLASWDEIENAKGYRYVIDNGEEQLTTLTSVQLQANQSIKVKAVGDSTHLDSKFSESVKYEVEDTKVYGLPTLKTGFYMKNSDLIQEGDTRYLTYITNNTQGEEDNVIAVRKATKYEKGWAYEDENIVLTGTENGWDEYINSASIVKGTFKYQDNDYSYLMVYAATDQANEKCNQIGMAVSNNPTETFVKVGTEPVIKYDSVVYEKFEGCMSPSVINYDKASGIRIFYTYADKYGHFARFYDFDCENLDTVSSVDASYTNHITNTGNLQGGEDVLMFPNADFAYDKTNERFVCVKDVSPAGSTNPQVAMSVELAYIVEEELYTTDIETGFVSLGTYDGLDLNINYERVYNASLVSDEYGYITETMEIVYTVAELEQDNPDYLYTQHFLDLIIQ